MSDYFVSPPSSHASAQTGLWSRIGRLLTGDLGWSRRSYGFGRVRQRSAGVAVPMLVSCGILVGVTLAAGATMLTPTSRQQDIVNGQLELKKFVHVLAEEIGRGFQAEELVQLDLIGDMTNAGIDSSQKFAINRTSPEIHNDLVLRIAGLPHISGVALIDPRGQLIDVSHSWPVKVAERDFFQALSKDPKLTSFISDVSIQEQAALAEWRHEAILIGAATACAVVGFLLLFRVIARQHWRMADQSALWQQTAVALRASERHLAQKSRMLEATLEHMDQGLIMIDDERTVAICNRRAIELLELPPDLMAGRPRFEDVLEFQRSQNEFILSDGEFRSFVQQALLLAGPRIYERRRPDGRVLEVRTTVLPEGEAVRTFTDVTERHNAIESLSLAKEQAEGANRAKSAFLANMSHELRTPLNAIIGFSELIHDQTAGPLDKRYLSYAKDINASGVHLLDLVNDLLDLSKIEAGRYELAYERVNLGELLRLCLRMLKPRAEAGQVGIVCDPDLVGVTLLIDRRAVKQVLLNLLANAVKFSPAGGVAAVRAERTMDDGIALLVSDDGIGIEAEKLGFLFEPFHQADATISRRFGGTGLGLTISQRLMGLHGGSLEITSQPETGTTVRAIFPAERVVRVAPARADSV